MRLEPGRFNTRVRVLRGQEVLAESAIATLVIFSVEGWIRWRGSFVVGEDLGLPVGGETLRLEFENGAAGDGIVLEPTGWPRAYPFRGGTKLEGPSKAT